MRLRRLEAEVVRDAILAVSGDLDRKAGGPPVMIQARPDGMVTVDRERPRQPRRSISPQRLSADSPGLQPLALDGLRPAAGRDQLPGSRRVGPAAAVAVHDQRRVPGRTGRAFRQEGGKVHRRRGSSERDRSTGRSGWPWPVDPNPVGNRNVRRSVAPPDGARPLRRHAPPTRPRTRHSSSFA